MTGLEFLLLVVIGGFTAKALVTDGAAAIRGKEPPSQKRWAARQKRRAERGQKPEREPGYFRRLWSNATEEWAEKNKHRHAARMDYIAQREPHKRARWRDRKLARAEKWEAARDKVAARGGLAWQHIKNAPHAIRDAKAEKQAWAENAQYDERIARWRDAIGRGGPSDVLSAEEWNSLPSALRDQLIAEAEDAGYSAVGQRSDGSTGYLQQVNPAEAGDTDDGKTGATVLPFTRPTNDEQPDTTANTDPIPVAHDTATPEKQEDIPDLDQLNHTQNSPTENTGGITPMQPTGEVTDLNSAVTFCQQMADYFTQLVQRFEEPASQAEQAATDLAQSRSVVENAQSALEMTGFTGQITGPLAEAGEGATSAGSVMEDVSKQLATAREQLQMAAAQFSAAKQVLDQQQGLAEQVQTQKSAGAGVATNTEFYANA